MELFMKFLSLFMKFLSISIIIVCAGCTTVSKTVSNTVQNSSYDFDWRHTDIDGQISNIPYHLDLNKGELQIDVFEHKSIIGPGKHTFEIESGKAEYKLKYLLGRQYNYPITDSKDEEPSDSMTQHSLLQHNQANNSNQPIISTLAQ